jgi:DNA adenine methylase
MTYPGGKGACYQQIINQIPPHDVYIETHLGGGSVLLKKLPARRNIGIDLDSEAINQVSVELLSVGNTVSVDDAPVPSIPMVKARTGINGGGAVPSIPVVSPGSTINHGDNCRHVPPEMMMTAETAETGDIAGGYELFTMDCLDFLEDHLFTGNEFVYADPPYVRDVRRSARSIYRYEYTNSDHVKLLTRLRQLPCPVMVSGYWSDLYADMLSDWRTYTFDAQTRSGKTATEWLWMNYKTPVALHDYRYLGIDYRERERIKRKKTRWANRLATMDILERGAIMWALREAKFI